MRKNSPRKWLHACLDLLPVILIPVFMIYSHRHTIDNGSVEIPQNQVVDFNQLEQVSFYSVNSSSVIYSAIGSDNLCIKKDDIVLVKYYQNFDLESNVRNTLGFIDIDNNYIWFNENEDRNLTEDWYFERWQAIKDSRILCYWLQSAVPTIESSLDDIQVFNLTQMFGSGNEPTIQQFNQWYTQDYYDYTLSHKELLKNISTITYSDTDIMSQFTYQLYNSIDKYFNMGNVFNMTSVYDWFNLNIFNGNAPISIYIVWNIVLYEFVMDLLFLLYGLFMWFIDMVEHIMDKPFKSIK